MWGTFFAVTHCKLFSISSVSFVLGCTDINMCCYTKLTSTFPVKWAVTENNIVLKGWLLTGAVDRLVLSLTRSFSFCWRSQHHFLLIWDILTDTQSSLPSTHSHTSYKQTHSCSVRKVATHVVSNLIGTEEAIRQTAQGEVAPVMWNGSH